MTSSNLSLQDGSYDDLIAVYEGLPQTKIVQRALSLLFRLTDQYGKEKPLVDIALSEHPKDPYFSKRRQWHSLDAFDQLVPRPAMPAALKSETCIEQSDLDNLIVVTGGDSGFFTWIVEAIESVRAGETLKNVAIGVLDCGLEDAQKRHLVTSYSNITILDPGFDFATEEDLQKSWNCGIPDSEINAFKAITSRAYLDRHFPGYSYYFWLDADAWVQDETSVHDYVALAKKQAIGISENNFAYHCADTMFYNDRFMTKDMQAVLARGALATCAGVVCLTPKFMAAWRAEVEDLFAKKGIVNNSPSIWYSIHKYIDQPEFLPHRHQFFFKREGLPLVGDQQVLYGAISRQPVGIIHLNGFYGVREKYRYFPTRNLDWAVDQTDHIDQSWKAIVRAKANLNTDPMDMDIFPGQSSFSFRYRVWPWQDKAELKEQLRVTILGDENAHA